ncbi:hypothetical protein J3T65_01625 [Staphylococcus simiae]|uniref:hypothetical protein n=1 Tax=Staphylococcus simiae TaxID=308354 RepID=UPI001A974C1A|nr:hypothetical protein [Staphylococcus simiae]MBO1198353.1 hypothetical protein [Staphylococcus simiae]MBO1200355.1 hypothetical protein [Staphylococcus simiae]MBO1202628.1 hypothetical protein [Staphylococcus simiae]MBO1210345.1 hypothetical protein [Staphylococcus simiae]MBO1228798.1 hypothetical protein [Staphylococcus simiae]
MVVNHAGTLSVDYFIGYLKLVMTSKDMCLNEAVAYMKSSFFKDNIETYGELTAHNFKQAVQELK